MTRRVAERGFGIKWHIWIVFEVTCTLFGWLVWGCLFLELRSSLSTSLVSLCHIIVLLNCLLLIHNKVIGDVAYIVCSIWLLCQLLLLITTGGSITLLKLVCLTLSIFPQNWVTSLSILHLRLLWGLQEGTISKWFVLVFRVWRWSLVLWFAVNHRFKLRNMHLLIRVGSRAILCW